MAKKRIPAPIPLPLTCQLLVLNRYHFTFSKKKAEVQFSHGACNKTIFPLAEEEKELLLKMLEPGLPALVYYRGVPDKLRAMAIYALSMERVGNFSATLLLGEVDTNLYGWQSVQMVIYPITNGPRRKRVEIEIIEREGEKLFQTDGVIFDLLDATQEYCDGVLSIYRDGELFDQTDRIEWYGTHGASPCFIGLKKALPNHYWATSGASASDFEVGDKLVLEMCLSLDQNFDFAAYIRLNACGITALHQALPVGETVSMEELDKRMSKEMQGSVERFAADPIVRFRS